MGTPWSIIDSLCLPAPSPGFLYCTLPGAQMKTEGYSTSLLRFLAYRKCYHFALTSLIHSGNVALITRSLIVSAWELLWGLGISIYSSSPDAAYLLHSSEGFCWVLGLITHPVWTWPEFRRVRFTQLDCFAVSKDMVSWEKSVIH